MAALRTAWVALMGALLGGAIQLNKLALLEATALPDRGAFFVRLAVAGAVGAVVLAVVFQLVARRLDRAMLGRHAASYGVFGLGAIAAAFGVSLRGGIVWALLGAFAAANTWAYLASVDGTRRRRVTASTEWIAALFLLSGVAALIYQVTWQRTLFGVFGVNIESVTIVVTVFMLGLGFGSLVGGRLSRRPPETLPRLFLLCEVAIAGFGAISLPLMQGIGSVTSALPLASTVAVVVGLLFFPTMMMGATLPILVAYVHHAYKHVGRSVGLLYFLNTLGSAIACFATVDLIFVFVGQQVAVIIAALFNATVGYLVYEARA